MRCDQGKPYFAWLCDEQICVYYFFPYEKYYLRTKIWMERPAVSFPPVLDSASLFLFLNDCWLLCVNLELDKPKETSVRYPNVIDPRPLLDPYIVNATSAYLFQVAHSKHRSDAQLILRLLDVFQRLQWHLYGSYKPSSNSFMWQSHLISNNEDIIPHIGEAITNLSAITIV